jgi:hypothetical protein
MTHCIEITFFHPRRTVELRIYPPAQNRWSELETLERPARSLRLPEKQSGQDSGRKESVFARCVAAMCNVVTSSLTVRVGGLRVMSCLNPFGSGFFAVGIREQRDGMLD